MKRILGLAVAVLLLVGAVGTGVAHASTFKSGDSATVAADETVDGALYVAGSQITIAGTVKGDVFCAGQSVEITGMVEGDVLCAAQNMILKGEVQGDIRAAAQNMSVQSTVDGSATVAGQTVLLEKESNVHHDITAYGMTLRLLGSVGRDIVAGAESVELAGMVGRDAQLQSDAVKVTSGASLLGNLTYTSAKQASIDQGAAVAGKTERKDPPQQETQSKGKQFAAHVMSATYFFAAMLLLGLVFRLAAPRSFVAVQKQAGTSPLVSMAVGAAAFLTMPIAAFLLLLPAVGLAVSAVVFMVWGLGLLAGTVYGSHALGRFVLAHTKQPSQWVTVTSITVGLLLLALTMLVPLLGGLALSIVSLWGFGAILRSLHQSQQLTHAKK